MVGYEPRVIGDNPPVPKEDFRPGELQIQVSTDWVKTFTAAKAGEVKNHDRHR
jgi:hypothetical protein